MPNESGASPAQPAGIIRVGPAGWAYDDWKGIVYPAGVGRTTHPLALLGTWFDAVEVNASFYRQPSATHARTWLPHIQTNPRFQFTVKLWQGFTHAQGPWPGSAEADRFRAGIAPLLDAGRLGAVLAQFPWRFRRTPENRQWLARVADAMAGLPLAVEMRHASWNHPGFLQTLRERGIAFCNVDQPLLHDCLPPTGHATAPMAYVRLHGRNAENWFREDAGRNDRYNYLYAPGELAEWVARIRAMRPQVNDLFVITNTHYRGQAVANALELQGALGLFHAAPPPPELTALYPQLRVKRHGEEG